MDCQSLSNLYKNELLNNIIPLWLKKSPDAKYGGYFTCINWSLNVFDTYKFIWLPGLEVWLFSMLYYNLWEKSIRALNIN